MALSTVVKNYQDGSLVLTDGTTPTPKSITVLLDQGDFSITGLAAKAQEVTAYESRGLMKSLRHTTRTYPTFSFTAMVSDFSENDTGTVADAILRNGTTWSDALSTSTGASTGATNKIPYTLKLTFNLEKTDLGDSADEQFILDDCYVTIDMSEGDPNTFSISGTVYGSITGHLPVVTP